MYFHASNNEKRIPSLQNLFNSHSVAAGDIVKLECEQGNYYLHFYKKGEISIKPNSIFYIELADNKEQASSLDAVTSLQQIFYGAPGTGKSFEINMLTKKKEVIRTTFHPDSDYSTFVGAYKPTSVEVPVRDVTGKVIIENEKQVTENRIVYEFVEQAFLQAYIKAWKAYAAVEAGEKPIEQYLVIEEINRGNCAQIFGDLFQLLDRNAYGFSDYPITADKDMKKQLAKAFKEVTIADADKINAIYDKDVIKTYGASLEIAGIIPDFALKLCSLDSRVITGSELNEILLERVFSNLSKETDTSLVDADELGIEIAVFGYNGKECTVAADRYDRLDRDLIERGKQNTGRNVIYLPLQLLLENRRITAAEDNLCSLYRCLIPCITGVVRYYAVIHKYSLSCFLPIYLNTFLHKNT